MATLSREMWSGLRGTGCATELSYAVQGPGFGDGMGGCRLEDPVGDVDVCGGEWVRCACRFTFRANCTNLVLLRREIIVTTSCHFNIGYAIVICHCVNTSVSILS